ncbi:MAG: polysaccharide biosynthesis tyrosine autokinase, partial [Acidobacteriota bacterium]|nr:polysaccharide biosynthesis tyrosine autokinase [Acidobacteriota bacterium]
MYKYQKTLPVPPVPLNMGDETPGGHPSSFVDIVLRRKGTIALFAAACGLLAFGLTAPRTRIYRAHTSLEFAGVNDNVLNTREVDPSATGDNSSQAYINTQARVLQSTPLLQRVVTSVKSKRTAGDSERKKKALQYLTARSLAADVTVRPGDASKLIDIYVDSPDPDAAADIANALTSEYMALNVEARMGSTKQTAAWLAQQMADARQKLETSEAALQAYARKSNLVFTHEDGSVAEARLRDLQDEYSKAQADRVARQAVYEGVVAEKPEAMNAALKDSALQDYQLKLSDLNRQLADLSTTYQPGYQKVQRLKSQIEELKKDYSKQHDSALNRLRNEYETARRREDMLRKAYMGQQGAVTAEASTAVDYNILKREAETNRSIYEGMLQKVKSYGIVSAMQPSNTRVIDPAEAPSFPYKPNVPLMTAFGLMGGAFLGLVWVGVRDKGEVNVAYPGQTNMLLQANELGVVPSARLDPYLSVNRKKELPGSVSAPAGDKTSTLHKRMETAMWFCKSSLTAESVRSIRTSLVAKEQGGQSIQVVVITSLNPGHGKTSMVSNLGIAYAELGRRVLMIDGDVRSPGLHKIFGLSNKAGLLNMLDESAPREDFEGDLPVQETGVPSLSLLSSGPFPTGQSSSSLFYSERMLRLMAHLRLCYDVILIDTPPMT